MDIIFYHPTFDTPFWITELEKQLPGSRVREWKPVIINPLTMRWSGIRR
jgi:hypothetical protein